MTMRQYGATGEIMRRVAIELFSSGMLTSAASAAAASGLADAPRLHRGLFTAGVRKMASENVPCGIRRLYIAIRADITERKKAEEALQKAQHSLQAHAATLENTVAERTAQLREKIGELEAFSYSVSHDMRQPLRSMQGYARILLTDYGPKLEGDGRKYLERIKTSSNRLDRLIQDVLTYSKATRTEGAMTVIDLGHTVREIVETYPALRAVEIEVLVGDAPVLGYEVALTQCISNLLGNAVKFMPKDRKPIIKVWTDLNGHFIRLWVRDNGIGIAPADQQRIFDIFARVNSDELYEGTGIGLSIVKKAVEKMGGKVGLESEIGKGSLFWMDLQAAANGAPAPEVMAQSNGANGST